MRIRVIVDFDIEFETDGEDLDIDQIRGAALSCVHNHVENMMDNENELDGLVDRISDATDFLVSELGYEVKFG